MQADLQSSADAFGRALQEIVDKTRVDLNTIVRKALFDLLSALMKDNPKDTVRCAASWNLDTHWSDWVLPPGDYTSVDVSAKATAIIATLPDSDIYVLYNNIEYLMALEDGHSSLAPSGFIANAMLSFADHISRRAQELGYPV